MSDIFAPFILPLRREADALIVDAHGNTVLTVDPTRDLEEDQAEAIADHVFASLAIARQATPDVPVETTPYSRVHKIIAKRLDPTGEHASSGLVGRCAGEVLAAFATTNDHEKMLCDADALTRIANATIGPAMQPEQRCAEAIRALVAENAGLRAVLKEGAR